LKVGIELVKDNFKKYNALKENVVFVKGFFKDTMPNFQSEKIALLRLDGDMYSSTWEALENLYHKVSDGGYVIVDDYALNGCRKAIEDFRIKHSIEDTVINIDGIGAYWQKNKINANSLDEIYVNLCNTPSDINEHLPTLRKYAEKYCHITEMGMRWGVSTYALLSGNPKTLISYDINNNSCVEKLKILADKSKVDFRFIQADVRKIEIEPTDILFIDTLHNYNQLSEELRLHAQKVKEVIILHDTTTFGLIDEIENKSKKRGLRIAVEDFLEANDFWEIKEVFENNNGLTILGKYEDIKSPRRVKFVHPIESEVDVCIISYAKTKELKKVTEHGIETLLKSEEKIKFNIFVVESNKDVSYNNYPNTKTIYTDKPFGYHRYLNLAIKEGKSPYVVLCNNDLTYQNGWASEIIRLMKLNPDLLSASPFCPQVKYEGSAGFSRDDSTKLFYGYEVRKQLYGWCIFQQRKIYDIIGELDENFEFWYADNDYSMELQKHKIKHAIIWSSTVNHHERNLGITGETTLSDKDMEKFTTGQYDKFKEKWEMEKVL
jgi:hypothetical protein